MSGNDHFFRLTNPYDLLPKELLGSLTSSTAPASTLQEGPDLFLDLFVDKRKVTINSIQRPNLDDFIDPGPLKETVKTKHSSSKTLKEEQAKRAAPVESHPRNQSPWSDVERAILDGTEFSDQLDAEFTKTSFAEDYERKLRNIAETPSRSISRSRTKSKSTKRLVLGLYEQGAAIKLLIEPSYKAFVPHEISLDYYVSQVKYLLCGVDSDIFQYDEAENKFFMKMGTYIEGITPSSLFELSRTFMETGTILRSLSSAVKGSLQGGSGILYPVSMSFTLLFSIFV